MRNTLSPAIVEEIMTTKLIFIVFFLLGVYTYTLIPKDYNAYSTSQNTPVASSSAISGVVYNENCVRYQQEGTVKVECTKPNK